MVRVRWGFANLGLMWFVEDKDGENPVHVALYCTKSKVDYVGCDGYLNPVSFRVRDPHIRLGHGMRWYICITSRQNGNRWEKLGMMVTI